jgi:PAS domain S-box-containing protein
LIGLENLSDAAGLAETILGLMPGASVMVVDPDRRVVVMQGAAYERHGHDARAAIGRDLHDVIPAAAWAQVGEHWGAALAGESRTLDAESADGLGVYWLHFAPLGPVERPIGAVMVAQDITDRVRVRDQIRHRLTQQALVSALGSFALRGHGVTELFDEAARVLNETLASDLIMVVETTAEGEIMVRASAGEPPPQPPEPSPELRRSVSRLREVGETLLTPDLGTETRFRSPGLAAEGFVSLVSAPIGKGLKAFGEVVACSRRRGAFPEDDLAFVESIANVLMATVERERADVRAAHAESRMSQFWQLSNDLLAIFSSDGRFLQASAAWERTLGWTPEELIGRSALELVVDEDRAATQAGAGPALRGADTAPEVVSRVRAKDGSARWLLWSMHQGPDGSLYAVGKDITERHEQQALTARREEQLNDAQRLARVGSWEVDFESGRSTLSASLREMLALDAEGGVLDRVHPEDRDRVEAAIANAEPAEFRVLLPDGEQLVCASLVRPVLDQTGARTGLAGTIKDVTEQLRAEAALRRSEERFRQGFDNAPIAMSLIDPATFRYVRVNDAFCSMVGRTREDLGALSFAEISHADELSIMMERLPRLVSGELEQVVTEKRYVRPDGSEVWASISVVPVREPNGTVDVLFGQMVDITERKAGEAELKAQLDEIAGLGEIRRAFAEDRFELHAQPIVDLATGATVQRELLIRMRATDGSLIPPGDFLPAAEKYGAIQDIDRWVIAQGAELAGRGIDVEINISAASIGDTGLIGLIESELERTGADPSRLVFEITETALIEHTDIAVALAERLRTLGCRFALDDFGTGYGGFHYLKHLPMDFLKIDREFVRDAMNSEGDQHVIRAIVGLAQGFGLQTIAEGVEDEATLTLLREFGVDHAQGFHLGRPAPLAPASEIRNRG